MNAIPRAKIISKTKKTCINDVFSSQKPAQNHDLTVDFIKIRISFKKMIDGIAEINDYNRVIISISLAKIRALYSDGLLANILGNAQEAMFRCKQRFNESGIFTFDDADKMAIISSLEINEKIITHSTSTQIDNAMAIFRNSINKSIKTGTGIANYIIWR